MSRNFLNEDFAEEEEDDDDFNPGAAQGSDHEDEQIKVCLCVFFVERDVWGETAS